MLTAREIDKVRSLGWVEAADALKDLPSNKLVELIDHRFSKVAGTATYLLRQRKQESLIVEALLNDRLHTRLGKMRGINTLTPLGMHCPEAIPAYEHMISDRAYDVVDCALFGIVFLGNTDSIPLIENRIRVVKNPKTVATLKLALRALTKDDPYLFSPGYGRSEIRRWRKHLTPKLERAARAEERISRS